MLFAGMVQHADLAIELPWAARISPITFRLGRSTTRPETRQTETLARWSLSDSNVRLQSHEKGQRMNRGASKGNFLSVSVSVRLALACMISTLAESTHGQPLLLKAEAFDADPGWDGRNNRTTDPAPRQIVQNFGFSGSSSNAGGSAGEIGGFITPAGEPAFYGKVITPTSFSNVLSASGILNVPQGGGHTLIGFFNADTVNEWRTPNTIALRIYGRNTYFYAYLEYGTGLWRAGGGSFGGEAAIPSGAASYSFSLNYDPNGAGGLGTVTATLGRYSTVLTLDAGHKSDGAIFNRFGILNVMKSADDPGQIWLDNVTINGEAHPFNSDPGWDELNNRNTYISAN